MVFCSNEDCQGREIAARRGHSKALNLMGDWCGPTVRHQLIENKGASLADYKRC
jgi:hypothetical protein